MFITFTTRELGTLRRTLNSVTFQLKRQIQEADLNNCTFSSSRAKSANSFLETLWRRKLRILPHDLGWLIYDLAKRLPMSKIAAQSTNKDVQGLLVVTKPSLSFNPSELAEGLIFCANSDSAPMTNSFVSTYATRCF